MTDTPKPNCENCGQPIGKLEKLHTWENSKVCWQCHKKLNEQRKAQTEKNFPAPEVLGYKMLKFVADCIWYLGWVALLIGIPIGLVATLITSMSTNRSTVGVWLVILLNCALWGLGATATAQFLYCIRDTARNSWVLTQKLALSRICLFDSVRIV